MTKRFATGKHAKAECDRCGLAYPHLSLRPEYENDRPTNLRVCRSCYDGEHPQDSLLPKVRAHDPQGLRHPRPQGNLEQQRQISTPYVPWSPGMPVPGSET